MGSDDNRKGGFLNERESFKFALRALEMSDLDFLYEFENDNGLSDCTTHLMPLSRGAMKPFHIEKSGKTMFFIYDNGDWS